MAPAVGQIEGSGHVFPMRVYYEDTDAAGIVYFANYLKFAERARSEYLRTTGIDQSALRRERGLFFAVRRAEVDYLKPARLDDMLSVVTELVYMSHVIFDARQAIRRGTEELARVFTRVVCLTVDGRPARLPKDLRELFLPLMRPAGDGPAQAADQAADRAAETLSRTATRG